MSLINDALRKARQEAADREAKERGLETPVVAGYWKRGGRLGVGLILGAVIAVGAAMIGGAMVWWALTERAERAAIGLPDDNLPDDAVISESRPDSSDGATSMEALPDSGSPAVVPARAPEDKGERSLRPEDEAAGRTDRQGGEGALEESDSKPVASPTPQTPALEEGEFVGEAKVGDVTLTLDYLVYRKENPFAQINGNDLRVGGVVEDFVVKRITVDSVELAKGETTIVIRVQ